MQDLATLIKTGKGELFDDPQSGSILKLLGENGFKAKIEAGSVTGHTYTLIHNPPSTEFLLVDMWNEGGHQRKAYHAFTIKTQPLPKQESVASPYNEERPEHPMITYLKKLNADADTLLKRTQKYV